MKLHFAIPVFNKLAAERFGVSQPKTYEELVAAKYHCNLIIPNPGYSGTGFVFCASILKEMGPEKGWAYLKRLYGHTRLLTKDGGDPARYIGWGDGVVGITGLFRAMTEQSKGAPIEMLFFKEGVFCGMDACALVKKPKIKDGAKEFLDWFYSEDVLRSFARRYPYTIWADEDMSRSPHFARLPKDLPSRLIMNIEVETSPERFRALCKRIHEMFADEPCECDKPQ